MNTFAGIIVAAAVCAVPVAAQRVVVIDRDTVVSADIVIDTGTTLFIRAGVTIRFDGYRQVRVSGLLVVEGTSDKPVLISTVDRPRGSVERPSWQGINVIGKDAHARLRHCRIEGAYTNGFWQCNARLDSCELVGNYRAVYCARNAQVSLRSCRIYRNVFGVVSNAGLPLMLDNTITENDVGVQVGPSSVQLTGRNDIRLNKVDIVADKTFLPGDSAVPVQKLWDVMRSLY